MIKKLLILAVVLGLSIWIGRSIHSYNHGDKTSVQQRFTDIMKTANEEEQELLKEVDEKKRKAIQVIKDKRDAILEQQQKELFKQH